MQNTAILSLLATTLLLSACSGSASSGQQPTTEPVASTVEFSSKTFSVATDMATDRDMAGADIRMIFGKDTTGIFRLTKGSVMQQMGFSWHIDGDSLRLGQIDEVTLKAKSTPDLYQLPSTVYQIAKEGNGYLLHGKVGQMILSPLK